jgi:hypothetical protein
MKKALILCAGMALWLSSCTISHTLNITGAPMGTKVGVAKSSVSETGDYGLKAAAKNGGINKIGAYEVKIKVFIFMRTTTTVYGQ